MRYLLLWFAKGLIVKINVGTISLTPIRKDWLIFYRRRIAKATVKYFFLYFVTGSNLRIFHCFKWTAEEVTWPFLAVYFVLDWDSWNVVVYEVQENESFSKLVKFPHFGIENEFPSANLQEKLIEPKEKYLLKKPCVFDLQVCR